jgi:AcrR family transcriptional regulator
VQVSWIRPPVQGRSQRTLRSLLDAAEALLASRPFDEVSVAEIAREAGASVGSFYARFGAKQDLLRALYARYVEVSRATLAVWLAPSTWAGRPLGEVIEALCAFVVQDHRERRGLRRAWVLAAPVDPALRAMMEGLTSQTRDGIARLLEDRRDEHDAEQPALAADVVHRIVYGVAEQDLWLDPAAFPGAELAAQTARAVSRYLGVAP